MTSFSSSALVSPNIPDDVSSISGDQYDSRVGERNWTTIRCPTSDYYTNGGFQQLMNKLNNMEQMLRNSENERKKNRELIKTVGQKLDVMKKENELYKERMKNMEDMIAEMKEEKASYKKVMQELNENIKSLCEENRGLKKAVQKLQQKSSSDDKIIAELRKIAEKNKTLEKENESLKTTLEWNDFSIADCVFGKVRHRRSH